MSDANHKQVAETFRQAFALHRSGQLMRARALYERILKQDALHFDALHLSGVIAAQRKETLQAAQLISRAILSDAAHPSVFAAHNNLGAALKELKQPQAALVHLDRALALKPDFADAHKNRGSVLQDLRQFDAAIASFDRAIALNLSDSDAHYNRGNCLEAAGRFPAAVTSFDAALALKPDHVEAHLNRANVLRELVQYEAALAGYEAALRHDPHCAEAQLGKATLLLLLGNYADGFRLYEWRWKTADAPRKVSEQRNFGRPRWRGDGSIAGKTLLLHHEQGLGDTIQFSRFAAPLAALGAEVILEVRKPLAPLLQRLEGVSQLIVAGDPLPPFALHCPLLSVPHALGIGLDRIPVAARYLDADAEEIGRWQSRLGPKLKPRIGLAWRGNALNSHDRIRSIPLETWAERLPAGYQYVSLQKDMPEAERRVLAAHPAILDVTGELGDFKITAALCAILDLVLCVDTSVAHLCGALGVPAWVLLAANPDWRWLLDRTDSPWYPSVKLYRQTTPGDWTAPLERVAHDLREVLPL